MLNEKGKASTVVVGIIVAAAFIVAVALVYTAGPEKEAAPEAVSKRVKIDLKDKPAPVAAQGQPAITPPKAAASAQPPKDSGKQAPKEPVKPLIAAVKTPEPAVKREQTKAEAPKPEAKAVTPAPKPSAVKKAVVSKPKAAPANQWAVNLASFITDREAHEFKKSLRKAGYNAYVTSFKKDDITWYRVRAGFYKTEADAKKSGKSIAEKLKLENEPWVAKPTKAEISKFSK